PRFAGRGKCARDTFVIPLRQCLTGAVALTCGAHVSWRWHWRNKSPIRPRDAIPPRSRPSSPRSRQSSATASSRRRRGASSTPTARLGSPPDRPRAPPEAVVFPQATADVQDIVRICAERRVPVIPFGTGTSLEGHVNAPYGGVSIDFRDMNRVLAVNAQDLDCVVEPGIARKELNE